MSNQIGTITAYNKRRPFSSRRCRVSLSLWLIINTTTPNRIDWERKRQGSKEPFLLPFLPPNLIVPTTACGKLPCADADLSQTKQTV